ncbi:MAG: hypothetical protein ACRDT8_00070 [Micromonosporaceae bacterium]
MSGNVAADIIGGVIAIALLAGGMALDRWTRKPRPADEQADDVVAEFCCADHPDCDCERKRKIERRMRTIQRIGVSDRFWEKFRAAHHDVEGEIDV